LFNAFINHLIGFVQGICEYACVCSIGLQGYGVHYFQGVLSDKNYVMY